MTERTDTPFVDYEDEKVYTTELKTNLIQKKEPKGFRSAKEYSILVIKDNENLRHFLTDRLQSQYEILEADNGQSALQQAFDTVPDLIISDVIIPVYRKVKTLLNINVNVYILNTRLQKAKYLLLHEDLSISEVSYKVGFPSPAYFSTVFKSKFGVTPKTLRKNNSFHKVIFLHKSQCL